MNGRKTRFFSAVLIPIAVLATAAVFFPGCSSNPPELIRTKYQVNAFFDQTRNARYQRLSFFLQVDDKDGLDDIAEFRVTQENTGLFWSFTPDDWQIRQQEEETWIGSNAIVMQDFGPFPAGSYRATITDFAGYSRDTSITLPESKLSPDALRYPDIRFQNDSATLVSESPVMLFFYSSLDQFMYQKQYSQGTISLSSFDQPGQVRPYSVFLYQFNTAEGYGILSGPHRIP